MMHSHKFNQNLFGYLTFSVLLAFISQTTAKNECQKDPIKVGQELLDSAPTLIDGIKSGSFGGEMATKFLQKYAFGILCCQKIEPNEMNENFKILQNNFCQQLKNGKIEEAAKNVQSSAIKLMQTVKPKILHNIRQKIDENSFLDKENRKKMVKLLGHFKIGMDKLFGVINAKNVLRGVQQSKTGQSKAASMRQRRGKRSGIDPTVICYTDRSGSNSRRQNGCITGLVCAIFSFIGGIAAHFHLLFRPNRASEYFIVFVVLFIISVLVSILFCCICRG